MGHLYQIPGQLIISNKFEQDLYETFKTAFSWFSCYLSFQQKPFNFQYLISLGAVDCIITLIFETFTFWYWKELWEPQQMAEVKRDLSYINPCSICYKKLIDLNFVRKICQARLIQK